MIVTEKGKYLIPIEELINSQGEEELFFTFPDELIEKLDWKHGDVVEWIKGEEDCTWVIRKLT
jgi:hypothetical protein